MRLLESDPALADVCRDIEESTRDVEEIKEFAIPVVLLPSFDDLEVAQHSDSLRNTDAAYDPILCRIIINAVCFSHREDFVQRAILAHEVGHALCHIRRKLEGNPDASAFREDPEADWLACSWGYLEGLVKEREDSYGVEYAQILRLWEDREKYDNEMQRWYTRKLADLIK